MGKTIWDIAAIASDVAVRRSQRPHARWETFCREPGDLQPVCETADRFGKRKRNPDVNGMEESDRLIVPVKATNEAEAEELLEGRGRTKENT